MTSSPSSQESCPTCGRQPCQCAANMVMSPLIIIFSIIAILSLFGGPMTWPFSVIFGGLAWFMGKSQEGQK